MSIQIKLHVEDTVINLLDYHQSVTQNTDYTGCPSAKPVVQPISFSYETVKKDPFLEKLVSGKMSDYMKFVISPVSMNGKSTKIEIRDFYVIECYESFDGVSSRPMTTYVKVSFATIIINGVVMDVKYWKVTDPYTPAVTPTVINQEEEKKFTRCYLTNTENKEIQDYGKDETIVVNLETSNRIGDVITINLDDAEYDFEYNGSLLPNDTLKNIVIENDLEQIELKVIKQKNTD